jgi:branched-chain amino acid aminotransferase
MNHRRSVNGAGYHLRANGHGPQPQQAQETARPPFYSDCIWLDGDLVPYEEATVHLLSPTLHYGPGVFEGIRCYATARGPGIFRLEAHLQRFLQSVKVLGLLDLRWTMADLRRAVAATVQANSFQACYIRPVLYFGGSMGLDLDSYEPHLAVAAWEWDPLLGGASKQGVRVMVSSFTRMHPNASLTKGKLNGQYVNSILAKSVAKRAGFDEAILLDAEGYVAECTGENLFVVRDSVIYTPPRASVLEGITRDTVITLAGDLGYRVVEERLSRDQLYIADEIFICGTAAEVVPVAEVDFRPVGDGQRGPISRALQSLYFETVRGRGARSPGWVEYVMMEPLY